MTRHAGSLFLGILLTQCCSAQEDTDYFPDFSLVDQSVVLQKSHCIASVRATEMFPDDSGRMLIARTTNHLAVLKPDNTISTFQDLPFTPGGGSAGTNSFTFHPDFAKPEAAGFGKYYTISADADQTAPADFASGNPEEAVHMILSEWTVQDIGSNKFSGTGRELIRFQTEGFGHVADDVEFGPDGMLYVSVGDDNEGRTVSQDTQSVYGKILRIDPFGNNSANGQYGIPADNPFSNEVYASGFRNPWRISFDSETGRLFASDVGQHSFEEVSLVTSGGNYGWPLKEGDYVVNSFSATLPDAVTPDVPDAETNMTVAEQMGLTDPVLQFDHTDGASIIGGFVYHGSEFPSLKGMYIFSSWDEGDLYAGDPETGEIKLLLEKGTIAAFANGAAVAIEEDAYGEIMLWGTTCATRVVAERTQCDLDGDSVCDVEDLNLLLQNIGKSNVAFDLNASSGPIDTADRDLWLANAGNENSEAPYLLGDLNFDGTVNSADLNRIGQNWQKSDVVSYSDGDLNGDQLVDATDLNALGKNWAKTSLPELALSGTTASVPEPTSEILLTLSLLGLAACRGRVVK